MRKIIFEDGANQEEEILLIEEKEVSEDIEVTSSEVEQLIQFFRKEG